MSVEAQNYQDIGNDIYALARDGDLSETERADIISQYEQECSDIHTETCDGIQELRDAMDIFEESTHMRGNDIRNLQRIIQTGSDGYFGAGSFTAFMNYKNETSFEGGLEELLELYNQTGEHFNSLPIEQRRDLQAEGGRDGIFGPNTFRHMLSHNLVEGISSVVDAVEEVIVGDERITDRPELGEQDIVLIETEFEITGENVMSTIEMAFTQDTPELIFQALQSNVLSGNNTRSRAYIEALQQYISENEVYQQARSIFCDADIQHEDTGDIYTVDFRQNAILTQLITAIDVFGDVSYLKRSDGTYIRRYEPSGEYRTLGGDRLSIVTGTSVMIPNEQEIVRIRAYMDTIDRRGIPAVEDNRLGESGSFETSRIRNGERVEIVTYLRNSTRGGEAIAEMIEQGLLGETEIEAIRQVMEMENDRFFPVLMQDGSIIFMSNPTYMPDINGQGVSSVEAVHYANEHGYLLPTSLQANAARNQAQLRGALPSYNNEHLRDGEQEENTAAQIADLERLIEMYPNTFVGGLTKIWAFDNLLPEGDPRRREYPGLNGWYSNTRTGETIQGYSTWHASDADYDDYSQAAQFVSPVWIDAEGNIHGLAEEVSVQVSPDPINGPNNELGRNPSVDEILESLGFRETFLGDELVVNQPELDEQEEIEYNNGLEMTDEEFEAAKIEARENGIDPTYDEFIQEVREFSRSDKMQLQEVVGANVDGAPGIGTYTHYLHSKIREAGFSATEAASLKRIFSEGAAEELAQIESAYEIDLSEAPLDISPGDFIRYDVDYGNLTIVDGDTGEIVNIDVAIGTFDTIEVAFTQNDPDIIFQTLAQIRRNRGQSERYIVELQNYISENDAYEQARDIFCNTQTQETETGTIYTINFRGNRMLGQDITAIDLFGDIRYLKDGNTTYIRRLDVNPDFRSIEGMRLSISSGTSIMIPNTQETLRIQEYMDLIERQAEIRDSMENNLTNVIYAQDKETIEGYFTIVSEREQRDMLRNIESTVARERLFPNMRNMFTRQTGEGYVFDVGDSTALRALRAFTLFGDYKSLMVNGEEYQSIRSRVYRNESRSALSIISGDTVVSPIAESLRTEEDYEVLNEYPELARELGEWVANQRIYGANNDCGGAVGRMLLEFGLSQFPNQQGNIFSQLSDLPEGNAMRTWRFGYMYERVLDYMVEQGYVRVEEVDRPHDARPGAIIVFGRNAQRGTSVRRAAGHVEIKGNDNQYHSYYSSSVPGGSATSNSTDPEVYARHTGFVGKAYYPIMRF